MPKVTKTNLPKLPEPVKAFYCFTPGTSEADKQNDIAEVEKFVEHIKYENERR